MTWMGLFSEQHIVGGSVLHCLWIFKVLNGPWAWLNHNSKITAAEIGLFCIDTWLPAWRGSYNSCHSGAVFGFSWSHIPERNHYSCFIQSASGYGTRTGRAYQCTGTQKDRAQGTIWVSTRRCTDAHFIIKTRDTTLYSTLCVPVTAWLLAQLNVELSKRLLYLFIV